MNIDVQVAAGFDSQVEQAMHGNVGQHVIEKADTGGDVMLTGTIQIQFDGDLGLICGAFDFGSAHKNPFR
jgi:hypothetical protein